MSKLIIGCGYLGVRVARKWLAGGEPVFALTRRRERADEFSRLGLTPLIGDVRDLASLPGLPPTDHVLFAVGSDSRRGAPGASSIRDVFVRGLENVLTILNTTFECIIYISSTGVYAQDGGEWVDEDSPCHPVREGGRASWEAEQALASRVPESQRLVLRLAGIYGPHRLPRRSDIVAGQPIAAPSSGYVNLIHVEDAAEVVTALCRNRTRPALLNVSDGSPVLRREYFREMARLLRAPEPVFTNAAADSHVAARATTDKRISNQRLLQQPGIQLRFPSYREGLAASIAAEDHATD